LCKYSGYGKYGCLKHFDMNSWKPKNWKQNKKITHTKIYKTCCNQINKQVIHHPISKHLWQFLFNLCCFKKFHYYDQKGKFVLHPWRIFPIPDWCFDNYEIASFHHITINIFIIFVHNINTVIVKPLMFHGINNIPS
jgi:hypothetical protein